MGYFGYNFELNQWHLHIIVLFVLLVINALFVVILEEEANKKEQFNVFNEYPFLCYDLSLSPDDDYVTFDVRKHEFKTSLFKNQYVCTFWNLTTGLKKFVERKARIRFAQGLYENRYLQCGKESLKEPSGHMCAAFTKVSRLQQLKGRGLNIVLHWETHPDTSFVSDVLTYHNGKVKISENRFYFIYASILFRTNHSLSSLQPTCSYALRIIASSNDIERTLVKSEHMNNNTRSVDTVSAGGHVYLEKDTEVYVIVCDAGKVIHDSVGNTFGLMPLK